MQYGRKGKRNIHTHTPWTCTEHTGMHMVDWNEEGGIVVWNSRNFCTTQRRKKKFLERVCSADFTVNHVSKTVLIYLDTRQKKSSRKLPNEYTIKLTVILTMTVYDGYLLPTLKTIIPIKNTHAHTHLINTCSNKFGATLGLKIVHQSKKPALREKKINYYYVHIVIIIIIHNKHYII